MSWYDTHKLLIEKKMLEELKYENLICNFISQKARKIDIK